MTDETGRVQGGTAVDRILSDKQVGRGRLGLWENKRKR